LDVLEKTLNTDTRTTLEYWITLQDAVQSASKRMLSSFHLAETRGTDASNMGLSPPDDYELKIRSIEASGRSKKLSQKLQIQMKLIEKNLGDRKPRPPSLNLYRSNTPSYIDVRV